MANKGLKFEVNDNKILNVADLHCEIDNINAIYISRNSIERGKYSIIVVINNEANELYFKTDDELKIASEFKRICSAISEINPNFKTYFPYCFNFEKVKDIQGDKKILTNLVRLTFDSGYCLNFKASNKQLKSMLADKQAIEFQNFNSETNV